MSVLRCQLSWLSVGDAFSWRWWVNVSQGMQWLQGRVWGQVFSLPGGQSACGLVRLTSLTSREGSPLLHCSPRNVKPLALWKGGNSGHLLLGTQRDRLHFGHSVPVGLQLPPAKRQHVLWDRAPSVFWELGFHHPPGSPSLVRISAVTPSCFRMGRMSGMSLTPPT